MTAAIYFAIGSAAMAQTVNQAPQGADAQDAEQTASQEPASRTGERVTELQTVTVTAQKRTENLQEVPISIQVLGTQELEDLQVEDFDDYAKLLPSVSFQSFGPGFVQVYMRGVASGGDGNHSGPLPSVGMYLDEQPITTIQGALDLHIYDIERVEALAGPQGTLYGASSQAGTIRIITNKPDPTGFAAGYSVEANSVEDGGVGYGAEGFVNLPINDRAAIRLVGWSEKEAGYIDNVFGTRTFPSSGITIDNAERAENNYNDVYTTGARAALKLDLNDSWTITPTVMAQKQKAYGNFAYDPKVGELELTHFYREGSDDRWTQAALTVQGKIGNFDLVYAYSHLNRDVDTYGDYNDYAFWYDTLYGYGAYFYDDDGELINPSQYITGVDQYTKRSHELRIASPADNRWRFVAGVFWQQQNHDIQQRYWVDNLADVLSVTGWPDTIWLTKQVRRDHDEAVFGEVSFDITDKLTATAGARYFKVDNSLEGFFGFSEGYFPGADYGEAGCIDETDFHGAPCLVFDKNIKEDDHIGRFNLQYQLTDDKMIYATWSEGYRPGGINRRGTLPPYLSDYLTNYELGWKTTWLDNRLAFNGAVFEEEWEDFQFALLGANGLTEIKNANQARIRGLEANVNWAATYNLTLSGGVAFYDAELTEDYCGFTDANGVPITVCPPGTINPQTGDPVDGPEAPEGTRLPVTAEHKANLSARYIFELGEYEAYVQGTAVYEGTRTSDLRLLEREIIGDLDSYWLGDLSVGIRKNDWSIDFYVKNVFDERAELFKFTNCAETVCGNAVEDPLFPVPAQYADGQVYTVTTQPRTFGIRFTQNF